MMNRASELRILVLERVMERVMESNPRYQLGNLCDPGLLCGLTCSSGCPRVAVKDPSLRGLWHGNGTESAPGLQL